MLLDLNSTVDESSGIFVLDDTPANLIFMERLLGKAGYRRIRCSDQPERAEAEIAEFQPDLVILDLHMPKVSGFEVLETLRSKGRAAYLPILVFTADVTGEARRKALALGASDFLTKPGDASEIMLRVRNFLETRHLHRRLEEQNFALEEKVLERTRTLVEAQIETVERLALAGDYRDDNTGEHCRRVGDLSYAIAIAYGLSPIDAQVLRIAAPLHDIGKVAIPDAVLHKSGRLTLAEFETIKSHTLVGGQILADSRTEILQTAHAIALSHHEHWDGTGYPNGLKGEAIPLVGRIVGIADVYDALTSARPYKLSWTEAEAVAEIESMSGTQFDPQVVAAFLRTDAARPSFPGGLRK